MILAGLNERPYLKTVIVDNLKPGSFEKTKAEVLILSAFAGDATQDEYVKEADKFTDGAMLRFLGKNKKFGKPFETVTFYISPKKHPVVEKIILVGLGKAHELDNYKLRQVAGFVGKSLVKDVEVAQIYFPKEAQIEKRVDTFIVGFAGGKFDPGHHKSEKDGGDKKQFKNLTILLANWSGEATELVNKGLLLVESINKVREVVNRPANVVTPLYMTNFAKKIATENKLRIEVFSEKQINEMGMGIMASVAKGSDEDLYFVVMRYFGAGSKGPTLAIVGKGVTFDSGGISIKPSESMEWMKMDMAGAAACFGAMEVIAKLAPKINVICACPLTENLVSGKASKPGDVVSGLSGKTVEIINTDAEGRLILSDALTYVQKNFKPDYIVDVATLTGAACVALGTVASAALGRPQAFVERVIEAGRSTGERLWQLPLYDEYRDMLKSYIADIANIAAGRYGGTETGAKFLEEFVGEKQAWVHLDIAPTAWEESDKPYTSKGASGFALTTLVELALSFKK